MALAMATVGDLVRPRERGRYQGYDGDCWVLPRAGRGRRCRRARRGFAARAGASATEGDGAGLARVVRADVIDGVQAVFIVAAPLAALALLAVLALVEVPLQAAPGGAPARKAPAARAHTERMSAATATGEAS